MSEDLNNYGIFITDIYLLSYCGIILFFQVCKTTKKSVYLIELATKKYKNGTMLTKRIHASKKPLIIKHNNTITKSNYEIFPIKIDDEYLLPIEIKYGDDLYKKAEEYVDYPPIGYVYAIPIKDYLHKYWYNGITKKEKYKIN